MGSHKIAKLPRPIYIHFLQLTLQHTRPCRQFLGARVKTFDTLILTLKPLDSCPRNGVQGLIALTERRNVGAEPAEGASEYENLPLSHR